MLQQVSTNADVCGPEKLFDKTEKARFAAAEEGYTITKNNIWNISKILEIRKKSAYNNQGEKA